MISIDTLLTATAAMIGGLILLVSLFVFFKYFNLWLRAYVTRAVLDKSLDSQTAFEIVSIDIADIEVGDNIGARLQADQAEADVRVARARAEERRAQAVANEQEMKTRTVEDRAKVVLAEAAVPSAIAAAYKMGNLRATAVVAT